MRAFEIHIYRNGVWKIDSVFDDRELALYEARRADDTNRYAAILVVEETYHEETGKVDRRVISRSSRADKEAKARRAAGSGKPGPSRRPAAGKGREPVRKSRQPVQRAEQTPLLMALLVLLVFGAGLAGIVALSQIPK